MHQHRTHLKRQAARSREKTKRQKSAARRRIAQLSRRQADARSRGETGRTARRHPSLLAIAAPMTLRPRSRAADGQQHKHRIRGRQPTDRTAAGAQTPEQLSDISVEMSPGSSPCRNTGTGTKFSTAKVNLDTDSSNPTGSKFNDGMSDTTGELGHDHGSTNSRGNTPHESDRMRPFVSQGDPSQFIVIGSIGNQRVRILVDTGATISFISSTLVPTLTPKPEVKTSELSVVLGNNETQDTDHYVDVPLTIHNCSLPASLHLLQLPTAFDVIAGLDWLSHHDSTFTSERDLLRSLTRWVNVY